jgi:XTP/dITP diphosphohydrolase
VTSGAGAPRRVLVATRNEGKRAELAVLLAPLGARIVSLNDAGVAESAEEEGIEDFATFEENALAKARYFFARAGIPTIADDSGLAVDALGGKPGVRSRRWSGRSDLSGRALDAANNEALLAALREASTRDARFVCAIAYVDASRAIVRRGEVVGTVLERPRGRGGFGYDPLFLSSELGRTFGEATDGEKGRVSHRARAVQALCDALVPDAEDVSGH